MRQYPLPPEHYEQPSSIDHAGNRTDKNMTIGILGAGIIAALILMGSMFLIQSGEEAQINQPSTQSLADDNNTAPKVQE
jgi:hypothetical protein